MEFGICTGPENAATAAAAGLDYIEVNVQGFLQPTADEATFAAARDALLAGPLPARTACCFLPGSLKCVGPEVDRPAIRAWAETSFDRAASVGIDTIVFGSGGSRRIPEDFDGDRARDQFLDFLKELAPLAHDAGVTVAVEPLNSGECNFITSVAEGAALVAACDHPGVRLLADLYHMGREGEDPRALAEHGHLLAHVHLAEFPDRAAPGVAGCDFGPQVRALAEAGYDGRVSIESKWGDLEAELPAAVAAVKAIFGG